MGIIKSLKKYTNVKEIDPRVRICIECGSTIVLTDSKGVTCKECGSKKHFKKLEQNELQFSNKFKTGDTVRIIDSDENQSPSYKIKKMKKAKDGTRLYLLKSESKPISLLYNESDESHLVKVK